LTQNQGDALINKLDAGPISHQVAPGRRTPKQRINFRSKSSPPELLLALIN
jgi:hypothetical protein